MSPAFEAALAFVLRWEGGFVDHPHDPGGATNQGVTQATYDAHRARAGLPTRSVEFISKSEVESIYHDSYWLRAGCEQIAPPALALVVFDAAVNSGVGAALKWLSQTRDWPTFNAIRLEFLTGLSHWPSFGRGWTRRIAALTREAAQLEQTEHLLMVFDADQREAARLTVGDAGLLIRIRGNRVYVRPEPDNSPERR